MTNIDSADGIRVCSENHEENQLAIYSIMYSVWFTFSLFTRGCNQWCYAVGAGGSAAPIVFLTVGAPLPYFFKWAEYN